MGESARTKLNLKEVNGKNEAENGSKKRKTKQCFNTNEIK